MKAILEKCLLKWRIVKETPKKRTAPKLILYPYVKNVPVGSREGRAIIEDVDGTHWEAAHTSTEDVIRDFDSLRDWVIKEENKREG